jgi:molybdenum cofactor biosynthesis protein B
MWKEKVKFYVITISTSRYEELKKGQEVKDESGDLIVNELKRAGHEIAGKKIIPDNKILILKYIIDAIEMNEVDAIITTGGTGYSPTDYTSETVRKILDREIKGFADVFRFISYQQIGSASFMSDVIAGVISSKPIFCLPGSPRAVEIGVKMILEEIGHLLFILKGSK